jgi:diphosphomevalonate decarboxylase
LKSKPVALTATAIAHPNIAFIKYWGNRDDALRLPVNGSISMNLAGLETRTTVHFDGFLPADDVKIDGTVSSGIAFGRVIQLLDEVRFLSGLNHFAWVESESNFPTGAGIASSASAFAALALAATHAAGVTLSEEELSRLARHGSGSACRSIPGGFVEWLPGVSDADSFAVSIAPPSHWDLVDCIAILDTRHKKTGSSQGNALAGTSPLQSARVADSQRRLDICRSAILNHDFGVFSEIIELDSTMMHAVMMTSTPPLYYWQPATLTVIQAVRSARAQGLPACATVDAGPNVHVICEKNAEEAVIKLIGSIPGVQEIRLAHVGGPAHIVG